MYEAEVGKTSEIYPTIGSDQMAKPKVDIWSSKRIGTIWSPTSPVGAYEKPVAEHLVHGPSDASVDRFATVSRKVLAHVS